MTKGPDSRGIHDQINYDAAWGPPITVKARPFYHAAKSRQDTRGYSVARKPTHLVRREKKALFGGETSFAQD